MQSFKILLLFSAGINFCSANDLQVIDGSSIGGQISFFSEKVSSKFTNLLETLKSVKKREINFDELMPNYDEVIAEFSEKLAAIKNSINLSDPDKGSKVSEICTQLKGGVMHVMDSTMNLLTKFYVVIPRGKTSLAMNAAILGAVQFLFSIRLGTVKVLDNLQSFLEFLEYK